VSDECNIWGDPIKPLFKHQIEALDQSMESENFGLFMEAGTAKTRIILENAKYLYGKGKIDTLCVIAPNGVHRNWIDQCTEHLPGDFPYRSAFWRSGAGKEDSAYFDGVVKSREGLRILTYNVDTLSRLEGVRLMAAHLRGRKFLVAVDESHKIKTPGSKRTKSSYKIGDIADYRRILTGTPITKGYQDLYSQFRFLDWRIIGTKTYAEFKSMYCVFGGFAGTDIISYLNIDRLRNRIEPFIYEKLKKDCLDLPPETWQDIEVELSPEQRKHYKSIKDEMMADINGSVLELTKASARMVKLRQILSGFIKMEDGVIIRMPCPRLEAMADRVEEASGGKVIVWGHFNEDIEAISKKLDERGIGNVKYYGPVNSNQRYANLQKWREDPDTIALVANGATGGTGLTLNEADTDITFSHDYSYETWEQKHNRNHRAGQTKPVTHYELVARGTADRRMLNVIKNRGDLASAFRSVESLRELFRGDY
jgi:SNF2 family DNA or RNA helicase